jgi:hypothetical protein
MTQSFPILSAIELETALEKYDHLFLGCLIDRRSPCLLFGNEWVFIEPLFLDSLIDLAEASSVYPCATVEELTDHVIQRFERQTSMIVSEKARLLMMDGFRDLDVKLKSKRAAWCRVFMKSKGDASPYSLLVEIKTNLVLLKTIMAPEEDDISNW